jgi:hypothetical protein
MYTQEVKGANLVLYDVYFNDLPVIPDQNK